MLTAITAICWVRSKGHRGVINGIELSFRLVKALLSIKRSSTQLSQSSDLIVNNFQFRTLHGLIGQMQPLQWLSRSTDDYFII